MIFEPQITADVLMIRPASFCANLQTAESNHFQMTDCCIENAQLAAQSEFDRFSRALSNSGVRVHLFEDRPKPVSPDALFPNNWVSFHADGTAVLYPMLAPNRRQERRHDILESLISQHRFNIERLVDLTVYERRSRFLEGTGSLVLDRPNRLAFACISPRTHREVLEAFASQLNYEVIEFDALDAKGSPIYHTNVMLSVGTNFAAICIESIPPSQQDRVLSKLTETGKCILELSYSQIQGFAGNMLELATADGRSVVTMSERALQILTDVQRELLRETAGAIVSAALPTIETLGGGSARCMLAELHVQRRSATQATATIPRL
jgi:hypothetical protein